jgi:imidazolonepropionase-like amidohydrolase
VDDVRQYQQRKADFEKNQMRHVAASRLDLEAMIPAFVARGGRAELPVVIGVHKAVDIAAALRLARELGLRVILSGCEEGWRVAGELASAGVGCIVHPFEDLPHSFESLGSRLDNAALLARAGVTVALSPRLGAPHNGRTLRIEAGNAVANGLPFAEALRAITLTPARLFGVDDQVGSLTPGRLADVVLWSGDPLETSTRVRAVWVRGRALPLVSRQTLLRDRYMDVSRARPQVK